MKPETIAVQGEWAKGSLLTGEMSECLAHRT